MYNMDNKHEPQSEKFANLPNIKKGTKLNFSEYNITQTELLCWLDNNTKVKHVLKVENDYYIFFKRKDEHKKLSDFLVTKFNKENAA